MIHWSETALTFMGDGHHSPYQLFDRASSGALHSLNHNRDRLKSSMFKNFLKWGVDFDFLVAEFSKPFAIMRYVTNSHAAIPLEIFKDEIETLGRLFTDIQGLLMQWNSEAEKFLKQKISPAESPRWGKTLDLLRQEIRETTKKVKAKVDLDSRVAQAYGEWDLFLSQNIHSRELAWRHLCDLLVKMKRDGFSDIDTWLEHMKRWRKEYKNLELAKACQCLENYAKLKHLQKVLSVW